MQSHHRGDTGCRLFLYASLVIGLANFLFSGMTCGNIGRDHFMSTPTATAVRLLATVDPHGFPSASAWEIAPPVRFDADWQGKNNDPLLETEVRLLWTPDTLYVRFQAHYRSITVFPDSDPNGRRDLLWDRDVAEAFLQPDPSVPRCYKEFEVSPNGFWIDLDIAPREKRDLRSGLNRRVRIDETKKQWVAELSLPMKSLAMRFDPHATWRANFYRVEGQAEPRFYSAWSPTGTPQPNFHVPEAFGKLIFVESPIAHSQKDSQ
jgi:alpha-galactosidase